MIYEIVIICLNFATHSLKIVFLDYLLCRHLGSDKRILMIV